MSGGRPPQHFGFVQFEFAFALGPADGRYVTRSEADGEPDRIVVLRTVGAARRPGVGRRRPRRAEEGDEPARVPTVRATVIRAEGLGTAEEASEWLDGLRRDRERLTAEADSAARELNALLRAHRAAAADPSARDVAPAGATAVRAGYGSGEQVADGRFAAAYELPPTPPGSSARRRTESLAPDERLAAILSRREEVLACEELVLRARGDVQAGRSREAALQARIALESLLAELDDMDPERRAELDADREAVGRAANSALRGDLDHGVQEDVTAAVGRMEAALRVRRLRRV
ncbi:MAG: hypothetical protein QOK25_1265 [Thermoleophilaceae bacterium]|nr:hypothetical protein [Thermoleophilaceae bacterium]